MAKGMAGGVRSLSIGGVTADCNLFLAPLAGYTDAAFRRLCRENGAGLTTTEMVSCKGLIYSGKKTAELLKLAENEKPSCVQLFGSEPSVFSEVLGRDELKAFDIIDINMGCPMPKVTKNGDGSALLGDEITAGKIVEACAKFQKPVTVKIRTGLSREKINAVSFAKTLQSAGASLVTVHGRTAADMYTGKADWETIGLVAAALSIPIIGNGDVSGLEDIKEKLKRYPVAGLMLGRGALGDPGIFAKARGEESGLTLLETILRHIAYSESFYGEAYTVVNMRKHIAYYLKGVPGTKELKKEICLVRSLEKVKNMLMEALSKNIQEVK